MWATLMMQTLRTTITSSMPPFGLLRLLREGKAQQTEQVPAALPAQAPVLLCWAGASVAAIASAVVSVALPWATRTTVGLVLVLVASPLLGLTTEIEAAGTQIAGVLLSLDNQLQVLHSLLQKQPLLLPPAQGNPQKQQRRAVSERKLQMA